MNVIRSTAFYRPNISGIWEKKKIISKANLLMNEFFLDWAQTNISLILKYGVLRKFADAENLLVLTGLQNVNKKHTNRISDQVCTVRITDLDKLNLIKI